MSLALTLALLLAAKAQAPEATAAVPPPAAPAQRAVPASGDASVVHPENLDAALDELFAVAEDPVRVAVLPVIDVDRARGAALEAALVRALLDRSREEVVTPSMVQRRFDEAARAALAGGEVTPLGRLAADHVVLSEVVDAGGEVKLSLRLLHVESGAVRGAVATPLVAAAAATTARAPTTRAALARLADDLLLVIDALPGEIRYQRLAIAPFVSSGPAVTGSRVDRFVQAELGHLFAERGFLVVERQRLDAAMSQLSLGAALGEEGAPALGQLLDAQVVVLGSISEAGDRFVVACRAVDTQRGGVLGTARAMVPREGVVTMASDAMETRTAPEALFRSLVAPGWGQLYNQEPAKGVAFAAAGYGGALLTLGLGIGAGLSFGAYTGYRPAEGASPAETSSVAKGLREQTDVLLVATAVSAALTAVSWGAGAADAFLSAGD